MSKAKAVVTVAGLGFALTGCHGFAHGQAGFGYGPSYNQPAPCSQVLPPASQGPWPGPFIYAPVNAAQCNTTHVDVGPVGSPSYKKGRTTHRHESPRTGTWHRR